MKEKCFNLINKYWMYLLWVCSWVFVTKIDFLDISCDKRLVIVTIAAIYVILFMKYLMNRTENFDDGLVQMILLGSFLLRLVFVMFHPYDFSFHDLGSLVSGSESMYADGHIGYMQYLYEYGKLPDVDISKVWSFYNPPFFYAIAAIFLKINRMFGLDMITSLENVQMLTMLFATITIQVGYKILKEFDLSRRSITFALMILAFHPYFIIGGATLNNDILSILCMFLAVLYAIRWYKKETYKEIIKLAFAIGLGMMTKISVGLVAPAVALLFLMKCIKEKSYLHYFKQFVVFGVICIPLGMYWPIRNMMLYDMPLLFVQEVGAGSGQELNATILQRLNPFSWLDYGIPCLQFKPETEYNIWEMMFKTSMFDELFINKESSYDLFLGNLLLIVNIVLALASVVLGIYNDFKKKVKENWMMWFKVTLYVVVMVSYVKFCFNYPLICSMNFRYIVPTILVGAINIGVFMNYENRSQLIAGVLEYGCITFSILSAFVYMFVL